MKRVKPLETKKKRKKRKQFPNQQEEQSLGKLVCGSDFNWYEHRCSLIATSETTRKAAYSPKQLYESACEYFRYVETHPFYERKIAGTYYGEPMMVDVPKKRPMTLSGLLIFLEISSNSWYRIYKKRTRYSKVVSLIEMIIQDQKFTGAATGFFKENLIIRDLGLADKQDVTSKGKSIKPNISITNEMSVKDAEQAYKEMIKGIPKR